VKSTKLNSMLPVMGLAIVLAVQFVRSKATEWNLDPNHLAAMGGSAGAHLAAWVALHDDLAEAMRKANVPVVARIGPEVGRDSASDNVAIAGFLSRHLLAARQSKCGMIETVLAGLGNCISRETPRIAPAERTPWRNWPQLTATLPGGGSLVIELPEFLNGRMEPFGDGLVVSGRTTLKGFVEVTDNPQWRPIRDGYEIDILCKRGIHLRYEAKPGPGRLDVWCEVENRSGAALRRVEHFLCSQADGRHFGGPSSASSLASHFFVAGRYCSWDAIMGDDVLRALWRPGMKEDTGVQWLLARVKAEDLPDPIVHPMHRTSKQFVDCALIVQDHRTDPRKKLILMAEPGGSVFANARTGCIHANPRHGTIEDGQTSRSRFSVAVCEGDDIPGRMGESIRQFTQPKE
jgi:hypothetical protein